MRDKVFGWMLTKADQLLVILWCPWGGKLSRYEWWPDWLYRIKLIPRSWMLAPWNWAMAHGWEDTGNGFERISEEP